VLDRIDNSDPTDAADAALDAALDAADRSAASVGVSLSEMCSIVPVWSPASHGLEPDAAAGDPVLDAHFRSNRTSAHARMVRHAAAAYEADPLDRPMLRATRAALVAARSPDNPALQAAFLKQCPLVQERSRRHDEADTYAWGACMDRAAERQKGTASPPSEQIGDAICRMSREIWALHQSHVQEDPLNYEESEWLNSKFGDVFNSQGVCCCPMAHPLQVGFVLDQSTCWCDMHCDGCDGACTCAPSLPPGQTVWFCDQCRLELGDGIIICSTCMGYGDDPCGHMSRADDASLDSVREAARAARELLIEE